MTCFCSAYQFYTGTAVITMYNGCRDRNETLRCESACSTDAERSSLTEEGKAELISKNGLQVILITPCIAHVPYTISIQEHGTIVMIAFSSSCELPGHIS